MRALSLNKQESITAGLVQSPTPIDNSQQAGLLAHS